MKTKFPRDPMDGKYILSPRESKNLRIEIDQLKKEIEAKKIYRNRYSYRLQSNLLYDSSLLLMTFFCGFTLYLGILGDWFFY